MNEVILKADRRGRLRHTPEQKQALVEACETSGLGAPRFAALHGVNYQTLASWLKKRRQGGADHPVLRSLVPAGAMPRGWPSMEPDVKAQVTGIRPRRRAGELIHQFVR